MIRITPVDLAISGLFSFCLLLLGPSHVHAACMGDWDLSGHWELSQDNGYTVFLDLQQAGNQINGTAGFRSSNTSTSANPIQDGSITGRSFSLTVDWRNFPGNKLGVYTGSIDDQGHIGGTTYDKNHPGAKAGWSSGGTATCKVVSTTTPPSQASPKPIKRLGKLKKPAPPAAPPGTPAKKTATVTKDVDVYDAAGGNGNQLGHLTAPNTVELAGACQDSWCNVQGAAVPTGNGWVYDGPDYDSLAF
ncbi:MAG: hypothetical protein WBB50_00655 [Methyloceanibacter sp.]